VKERKSERETGSEEKKKEKGGESASAYVVAIYSWLAAHFVRIVCVRDRLREREPQKERASERESLRKRACVLCGSFCVAVPYSISFLAQWHGNTGLSPEVYSSVRKYRAILAAL